MFCHILRHGATLSGRQAAGPVAGGARCSWLAFAL